MKGGIVVDSQGWGGGDDDGDSKHEAVGGINVEKPWETAQICTEDSSSIIFMDEEDSKPGTGPGSVGRTIGAENPQEVLRIRRGRRNIFTHLC